MTSFRIGGTGQQRHRGGRVGRIGLAAVALASVLACSLPGFGDRDEDPPANSGEGQGSWQEQAATIDGLVDYTQTQPDLLDPRHVEGTVAYEVLPPVGGPHHEVWQNCSGDVYDAPIANEHAVHSLEHGAVWITYHPSLPADQVASLAARVSGNDKLFMSPFPELDAPISLQAWGYQLKVDSADDARIDEFIRLLRVNAGPEQTAPCTGGLDSTGTQPIS